MVSIEALNVGIVSIDLLKADLLHDIAFTVDDLTLLRVPQSNFLSCGKVHLNLLL